MDSVETTLDADTLERELLARVAALPRYVRPAVWSSRQPWTLQEAHEALARAGQAVTPLSLWDETVRQLSACGDYFARSPSHHDGSFGTLVSMFGSRTVVHALCARLDGDGTRLLVWRALMFTPALCDGAYADACLRTDNADALRGWLDVAALSVPLALLRRAVARPACAALLHEHAARWADSDAPWWWRPSLPPRTLAATAARALLHVDVAPSHARFGATERARHTALAAAVRATVARVCAAPPALRALAWRRCPPTHPVLRVAVRVRRARVPAALRWRYAYAASLPHARVALVDYFAADDDDDDDDDDGDDDGDDAAPFVLFPFAAAVWPGPARDAADVAARLTRLMGFALRDWRHVALCGGALVAALTGATATADIDLFVYGLPAGSAAEADAAGGYFACVRRIVAALREADPHATLLRNSRTLLWVPTAAAAPPVQIVLGRWASLGELLTDTDVDCCGAAWDGHTVWMTERARQAMRSRTVLATRNAQCMRGPGAYERRLAKYAARGFRVALPPHRHRDWDAVQPPPLHTEAGAQGVAAILHYARDPALAVRPSPLPRHLPPHELAAWVREQGYTEPDGYGTEESGYMVVDDAEATLHASNVWIPYEEDFDQDAPWDYVEQPEERSDEDNEDM